MGCSSSAPLETRPRRCCCLKWGTQSPSFDGDCDDEDEDEKDHRTPLAAGAKDPCGSASLGPKHEPKVPRSRSAPPPLSRGGLSCEDNWTGDEDEAYYSCDEAEQHTAMRSVAPAAHSRDSPKAKASSFDAKRLKAPTQNKNRVAQFKWCQELLQMITRNAANAAGTGPANRPSTPLFVVAGTCPNSWCGMQAVLFSHVMTPSKPDAGFVDFWWIKPMRSDSGALERQTLSLHQSGPHRNSPGKSRSIYAPLADKFKVDDGGDFLFGVDSSGRAFIEEDLGNGDRTRMLIYLVWQEAWSSAIAYTKFIRGKICYQKSSLEVGKSFVQRAGFYSREYQIRDGQLAIAPSSEEEAWPTVLPPDSFQRMSPEFQW